MGPAGLFGMYGLALRPKGAREMLRCVFPVSLQVDTELSRTYQHLRKVQGDTQARAFSSALDFGPRLRVYAPRSVLPGENSWEASRHWFGPLVVAPGSRSDCTDIQVLSSE